MNDPDPNVPTPPTPPSAPAPVLVWDPPPLPPRPLAALNYVERGRTGLRNRVARLLAPGRFSPVIALGELFLVVILLGAFAFIASLIVPYSIPGDVLMGLLLLAAVAILLRGLRRERARAILAYLEQAVRLNLPIPPLLLAAERSESRAIARRLRRLRDALDAGASVAASLESAVPATPRRWIELIDAGERAGRLRAVLARLIAADRGESPRRPDHAILLRWYCLVMLSACAIVVPAAARMVRPSAFQVRFRIYRPNPTLEYVGRIGHSGWASVLAVAAAAAALIALADLGAMIFSPRMPRPRLVDRLVDPLLWRLPVTGALARGRGLGDACDLIADAIEAGVPPHLALADAAALRTNAVLRARLRAWARLTERGTPIAESARAARLPALVSGMLRTTQATHDAPRAFRFLALYYRSRLTQAGELLKAAAVPAMALAFGVIVALFALSIFVPLIHLANQAMNDYRASGL